MVRIPEFTYHTHKTHKCARLSSGGLHSQSLTVIYHYQAASQGLTDGCHLNSAHLKPLTASFFCLSLLRRKRRRRRFSVTMAQQRSAIFRLFFAGPKGGLVSFHSGGRQWRQTKGLREHPSHLSVLITIQRGVKALPSFGRNKHPSLPQQQIITQICVLQMAEGAAMSSPFF